MVIQMEMLNPMILKELGVGFRRSKTASVAGRALAYSPRRERQSIGSVEAERSHAGEILYIRLLLGNYSKTSRDTIAQPSLNL